MTPLAERIRQLRLENGLTVRGLAKKLGKTAGYISRIEGRGEIPSPELICEIASVLAVPPEELLDLGKKSQLAQQEAQIRDRHEQALRLFRKEKR